MADIEINITDNSGEVLKALEQQTQAALTAIGITAEGFAKRLTPVDLGTLRNSITNTVVDNDVYIGTNIPYAPYVELGTGIYATDGRGRKSPWAYQDRKGQWHRTKGMKPHHMLKKAASEHNSEYKAIIEEYLKD
ncbi:HK97 gp10 family phage protein [Ruminococcus flavefaciens]|uniref:HK97 gp10 family phage protein n=1 Tax=Ruminococcus flavefaciens TaxID=1265 RepID=UPI0026EBB987|nr:HK97 gp10 family phage protein [Ruminococcus flavefaciens]